MSFCLLSVAPRLTAIGCRDKNLWIFEGRHGTDPNVAVRIGAVPYTVQEHECRGMIAPGRDCVYSTSVHPHTGTATATTELMERLRGCSCAMAAGSKCLSAAIAIAVTCTAPTAALGKRADARNATPVGVTRRAAAAASTMRREHAATGCAKIT